MSKRTLQSDFEQYAEMTSNIMRLNEELDEICLKRAKYVKSWHNMREDLTKGACIVLDKKSNTPIYRIDKPDSVVCFSSVELAKEMIGKDKRFIVSTKLDQLVGKNALINQYTHETLMGMDEYDLEGKETPNCGSALGVDPSNQ